MTVSEELQTLKDFHCEKRCVLSVYLNTNPADPDQQKGAWKIHLKTGFKRLEEYLEASNDKEELEAFQKAKNKVAIITKIKIHIKNNLFTCSFNFIFPPTLFYI